MGRDSKLIAPSASSVLLAGSLAAAMLFVCPALVDPYTLAQSAGAALFIALLWLWIYVDYESLPLSVSHALPSLLILAAMIASALTSADRAVAWLGPSHLHAYGLAAAIVFGAVHLATHVVGVARSSVWIVSAAGAVLGISAFAQWSGAGVLPGFWAPLVDGRATSLLGSPVSLGAVLAVAIPFAAVLVGTGRGWQPLLASGFLFLMLVGLFLSRSRGAWVSGAVGLGVALFWILGRGSRRSLLIVSAIAILGMSSAIFLRRAGSSDASRVAVWRSGLRIAIAHPILGSGPGAFENTLGQFTDERFIALHGRIHTQGHAHNGPINAAATGGLVLVGAWGFFLFRFFQSARRRSKGKSKELTAAASAGAVAAFIIQSFFNPLPVAAWMIAAMASGEMMREGPAKSGDTRGKAGLFSWSVFALCALVAWGFWGAMRADLALRLAREAVHAGAARTALVEFERATDFASWRVEPALEYVRALLTVSKNETDANRARELAWKAIAAARGLCEGRPAAPESWHTLAVAMIWARSLGLEMDTPEIAASLVRASQNTWYLPGLLETRIGFARSLGHVNESKQLESDLIHLLGILDPSVASKKLH